MALRFFTPDSEIIGTSLIDQLTEVLIMLKNHKWLKALNKIEQIESSLKQALTELDCKRLTTGKSDKNHEDSFIESMKKSVYKDLFGIIKALIVSILGLLVTWVSSMILGI